MAKANKKPAAAGKPSPAPANNALAKKLAAMNERFDAAKTESKNPGGGGGPPPGRYIGRLEKAELKDGDKGLYIMFKLTCTEGEETGESAFRFARFDSDEQLIYLQRDLRRLGQDVDDMEITDLPAICKKLTEENPGVRFTVKQNGEYTNVYIDKLVNLDGEDGGSAAPEPAEDPDDDEDDDDAAAEEPDAEDEDDDDAADEGAEVAVGSDVAFKHKKKDVQGTVVKIKGDDLIVKLDGTGEKVTVNVNEVEVLIDTD